MNRTQKRQLQAYLHFRDKPMSVLGLILFNWRIFLLLIVAGAATVGVMLYFHSTFQAWLFGVAYGSFLLRDLGHYIRWSRTWPLTSQLLDWPKVERMASENRLAA
ncbi:hypothetical protein ABB27_17305 [Stenotrophomonas terrae]|uniref:Uncharacterized protein n=1 Tax=Stenotrophomonas terrae TaxID=405446 RepID=A0A0R0C207_9GAMM|nr:hypothetical protein [Stenotrophomonas terrae]KRG63833.1 hypothetical protein ABB27_17305 [Stenotrophomonas terrae]